jgi:hypothetical protein
VKLSERDLRVSGGNINSTFYRARWHGPHYLRTVELLAREKVVVYRDLFDERPKLFLSRYVILTFAGIGINGWESGTQKQCSKGGNKPNEHRQKDEKAFQIISVLDVHGQELPEWIPFQEVQEAGVEEKRYRDAADPSNPGWFR